jgi:hypothetical protein
MMFKLKKRAWARGIWFQSLTIEERVLTSFIGKYVKIVRNTILAATIARIICKLVSAIKNHSINHVNERGKFIATAVAMKAYSYGNKDALNWMNDANYIRYMGLMWCEIGQSPYVQKKVTRNG